MAGRTPIIVEDTLSIQKGEAIYTIVVDSAEWFVWLETATVFTYREDGATFTAQKRSRKGHWYWYAYAKRAAHLQCVYLGRSPDLTQERLQAAMNRLYPLAENAIVSHATERYGSRSAQSTRAQQQLTALYGDNPSTQGQLNLAKVKEHLRQLDSLLQSDRGQATSASQQALDIAHTLVLAFEQLRDANTRDLAILRSLLHSVQERLWRYEAMVERPAHGEIF
jgi:hypothetical protein